MTDEVFADLIGEITFTGGVFRIDLLSLSPVERDAGGNPKAVLRQRIIMPPDGFLQSFTAMQDIMDKLVEAGIVKRNPRPAANPGGDGGVLPHAAGKPPSSPNF